MFTYLDIYRILQWCYEIKIGCSASGQKQITLQHVKCTHVRKMEYKPGCFLGGTKWIFCHFKDVRDNTCIALPQSVLYQRSGVIELEVWWYTGRRPQSQGTWRRISSAPTSTSEEPDTHSIHSIDVKLFFLRKSRLAWFFFYFWNLYHCFSKLVDDRFHSQFW